jgi:putative toxin-antitoxin system antitoxin component (TIGR02293 family)
MDSKARMLAKATAVFGSRVAAERWLERPALELDYQRPVDLLDTPTGANLVERFLGRLA